LQVKYTSQFCRLNVSFPVDQWVKWTYLKVVSIMYRCFLFLFNNASISLLESYRQVSHLNSLFVITSTKILMPKSCVMLLRCVLSSEMLSKWGTSVLMHHVPNMHLITYFNKPISGLVRFISWLVHFSSICLSLLSIFVQT
jgi:hypothetical protein